MLFRSEISTNSKRHKKEDDRGNKPQHEDVLRHREIDPADRWQMDQRLFVTAVRNVFDDDVARIEMFRLCFACSGRLLHDDCESEKKT